MKEARASGTNYPLRVDPEIMAKARYIADYNGRSLNKQIKWLMTDMIRRFEAEQGEITPALMEQLRAEADRKK